MDDESKNNIMRKSFSDTEVIVSECDNCENLKHDVENLVDLLLKLRLKVSQIGVDVNRAATKCDAAKSSVIAVENTLDDIGSLSTNSLQLEKDSNDEK